MVTEKLLRESLLQDVKTLALPIQFHRRIRDPRRRHAGLSVKIAANVFRHVAAVLRQVVEVKLGQTVKSLAGFVLGEVYRERWLSPMAENFQLLP